jgi:hypothetical protein
MLKHTVFATCVLVAGAAVAKLPPPTPEQQAAAALNAAKAAHATKVDAYTLCLSQTKIAEAYVRDQKAKGKVYTPEATAACADPGPFVPPTTTATGATPPQAAATSAQPAAASKQPAAEPAKK